MAEPIFKAMEVSEENLQRLIDWAHAEPTDHGVIVLGRLVPWGWMLIKRPVTHPKFDAAPFYSLEKWQFEKYFEEN